MLSSLSCGETNTSMGVWLQGGGKFLTLKACDLRCSPEDKQAPWKSQLNAKLMAQRRPLWLPGSAQAHTELFTAHGHSPFHPPTYPVCPQQKTEPSVWGPESSLHIISCNNWQVGHWLLASNPPGAREKKKKSPWMLHSSYLA